MRRHIPLAALAALASLAGCKETELPAGQLAPEVRALLAHVPAGSKVVGGLDLALARSSGLWERGLSDVVPDLIASGHRCGAELVKEVDRVIVSAPDQQPDTRQVHVALTGRFTEAGKSCLGEIATLRDGKLSWAGAVALVSPAAAPAAGAPITSTPAMMALLEKTDTTAVAWVAADTRGGAAGGRLPIPSELHAVTLWARPHGDGVAAAARLQVDTADRAEATAELFRDQKDAFKKALPDPKLGDILGRVEVIQKGPELAFRVSVDRAELDHLLGLRAMLGAGP